jgi:hypothetical protein
MIAKRDKNIIGDNGDTHVENIKFRPDLPSSPPHIEGMLFYDAESKTHVSYNDIIDTALNIGEETRIRVCNKTGFLISNGTPVRVNGVCIEDGLPTVEPAQADSPLRADSLVGLTTHDIGIDAEGIVTTFGKVSGIDTSSFDEGNILYLSATSPGTLTKNQPIYADYIMRIGIVVVSDVDAGVILVNIVGRIEDILENGWNGSFLETIDFTVTSDGVTILGNLEKDGGGDLTMNFSDGFTVLDTTPKQTIELTAGTATVPTTNFIYIPVTAKVLTKSTVGWPSGEHIKVANLVLLDAATTQARSALGVRNWNDHVAGTDQQGHVLHIDERVRALGAQWDSGVLPAVTIVPGSPDDVFLATTSGFIYQLHRQVFPALNLATGDDIHIFNDSVSPYRTTTNLNTELTDANGSSLANSRFNFVIWGIQNRSGQTSHLMLNLPTGAYTQNDPAIRDDEKTAVFTIPSAFQGIGFLIARITLRHQPAGGGTWSQLNIEDLRGTTPTIAGGVTSPVVTEFSDSVFKIFDNADITKIATFETSGITTGNTRTLSVPDESGEIMIVEKPKMIVPFGATQAAAGANAGEPWATSGHASLLDNILMIGV